MLTYESASELLNLNLEEEVELKILLEAALRRLQWRREQVVSNFIQIKFEFSQFSLVKFST